VAIYGLASGTFIVAGVVIATLLAVAYGTFAYRGSGIYPSRRRSDRRRARRRSQ
jgi:hypothetical protein